MSVWSQVAMIFRINYVNWGGVELDFEEIFGKTYTWESDEKYEENPQAFLPMGSEGSLDMSVWTNPHDSHLDHYTVSIFGSLRDHEEKDVEELIEWFYKKCKLVDDLTGIRQAVMTIENDEVGVITKTFVSPYLDKAPVVIEVGDIGMTTSIEGLNELASSDLLKGGYLDSKIPLKLELIAHEGEEV